VTKPRTSDRVPERQEFRGFCDLSPFYLHIFEICVIMHSKNNKAAERAQLNDGYMKNRKAPSGSGGSMRARRCARRRQAKEKTPSGVGASP
jgi:hypothetical protein